LPRRRPAPAVLEKDGPQLALMLGRQTERQRFIALRAL
jgi:hypothetical protein